LYKCPYCERQDFRKLNDQRAHIGEAHPGMDLNVCPVCYKTYLNRGILVTHLKRHTDERPFVCAICDKGFLFRSLLSRHMRIHTGERPFMCNICDADFTVKEALTSHMTSHGIGDAHVCADCNKPFGDVWKLRMHRLAHNGGKRYQCSQCSLGFGHAHLLDRHMRIHRGEEEFSCPECNHGFRYHATMKAHLKQDHQSQPQSDAVLPWKPSEPEKVLPDLLDVLRALRHETATSPLRVQCPYCRVNVTDLALHTSICPWRQGPSWQ